MNRHPPTLKTRLTALLAALCACAMLGASAYVEARRNESQQVKDPHYGEVLFYFYQQQYFSAITNLMTAQQFQRIDHHRDEAELLLGGMYLSYGLHIQAGEIFQRLIDAGAPPEIRDRAWFYLAKIRYQRGYLAEAGEAISRIQDALPGELEEERQLLQAQLLMEGNDYRQAAEVLARMRGQSVWAQYGRYNLGVALIKAGDNAAGTVFLEEVGGKPAADEELKSLKDKANVALGYAYLRDAAPVRAQARLELVRLDGLLSNKALLGIGWAHSAQNQNERSLVPWTELQKRNVIDSTVQEALLALPYALGRLGAYQQSLQQYETAIAVYTNEMARIDSSMTAIRSGKMVDAILQHDATNEMGWFWRMREVPDAPESRYLIHLMAGHDFQEALKNYRDLRFLSQNLDYWTNNIGIYGDMLATRRLAYAKRLPQVLQDERSHNFAELPARRDRYAAELARIENTNDVMGLANDKEQQLLARLSKVESALKRLSGHEDISAAQDKYRLLHGLLFWDVSSDYQPRLWQARKDLKTLDRNLAETRARREALMRAQVDAPRTFENFSARIVQLRGRITQLQSRVQAMASAHGHFLEELAVAELAAQKERLAAYLTQARFAVAQMYDEATNAGRGTK
jgi:hypothetical protein